MTTHDPNSADLHTNVTWMDRRDPLPALLSINARNRLDVWSADDFHRHLDGRHVIGKIAAHDGEPVRCRSRLSPDIRSLEPAASVRTFGAPAFRARSGGGLTYPISPHVDR